MNRGCVAWCSIVAALAGTFLACGQERAQPQATSSVRATQTPAPTVEPTAIVAPAARVVVFQTDGGTVEVNTITGEARAIMGSLKDMYYIPSPDGTKYAFACADDGSAYIGGEKANLCVWDSDGPSVPPVVTAAQFVRPGTLEDEQLGSMQGGWSPDGRLFAFLVHRLEADSGDVYVFDFDTGQATRVIEGGVAELWGPMKWAPDGTRFAVRRTPRSGPDDSLLIADVARASAEIVRGTTQGVSGIEQYEWSMDGGRLAFVQNQGLYTVTADGTSVQSLGAAWGGTAPAWSPDGQWIAVSRAEARFAQAYAVRSDGSREVALAPALPASDNVAWSPDSALVAFKGSESGEFNDRGLYVSGVDGGVPRLLTEDPPLATFPLIFWGEDGAHIFYTADAGPCREGCPPGFLYMIAADGSGAPQRITDTPVYQILGWRP